MWKLLLLESLLVLLLLSALLLFPHETVAYAAAMLGVVLLTHLALLTIKGPAFAIRQEAPGSPWKYCWFGAIFVAAFIAGAVEEELLEAAKAVRRMLGSGT